MRFNDLPFFTISFSYKWICDFKEFWMNPKPVQAMYNCYITVKK